MMDDTGEVPKAVSSPSTVHDIVTSAESTKEFPGNVVSTVPSKDEGDAEDESWKSVLLSSLDRLFELTASGYAKKEDSNEFLEKVFTELVVVRQTVIELDKTDQIKCADDIGDRPQFIASLVPFMAQVYKGLSNGYELKCLCDWQFLLVTLTNVSKTLRLKIVKESVHFEMIKQLIDLPKSLEHQELLADLIKMAMYVMLTLIQEKELHHYFSNCCYTDVLITYVPSKNFSIGKLAKISLSILYRHLDHNQAAKSLSLTQSDISIILKVLSNQSLSEDEEKESWHILSKDGVILALKGFCSLKANCIEFIKQGGLGILSTILDGTDAEEHEVTLLLLWQLSYHFGSEMKKMVEGSDNLVDKIRCLSSEEGSDLCDLKVCLPYSLLHTFPKGNEDCLMCVKTAYKHEFYEECICFCQEVTKNSSSTDYEPSTVNTITLFHGKASFYIFKQNLLAIKNLPVTSAGYSEKRRICFEGAKQAIHLLGIAFDNDFIDPEGSQLLDTASMLALSEPSSLKIDQRCLLCRSKQKKLARSHICPRAILDDFAKACGTPSSGKAFFVNWPWQSGISGTLKSAGQITIKLLCNDCESILSKNESQFLPKFFRKLYDPSSPTRIEIEQDIEYGGWLYQFCIGLIFRGLTFQYSGGRDEYLNENEVYSVFVQCREALLNSKGGPQISMYVAPTAATDESELSSSLINQVIHHPFHFFFTQNQGMYAYHQMFLHALSYTFQIGMMMTTVNFSLAHWTPDVSSIISPIKGSFRVPPNCNRLRAIPDALWETLLAEAVQMEKEVMEQPQRMTLLPLDQLLSVSPSSYMKSILNIASHSEGMGKESLVKGHPKIVNYIPSAFSFSHPQDFKGFTGKFELPSGHRVLLHLTTQQDEHTVNTAFIMVGEGPGYGADNPYLIIHHYKPGHQTNYGYFFSPNTFEFSSYLPDRTPKRFLDEDFKSSGLMDKSKEIISLVLRTKGFRNYHSLQYWMQAKRCTCGHCSIMESSRECVCCKEISMIMDNSDELEESSHVRVGCITEHPGFATVCLDVWVLQTAYYQYRQHYGSGTTAPPIHEPPTVLDTKCKYKSDFKCWYCNESCEICLEPTVLGPAYTDSTGNVLRFCSGDCSDIYKQKPEPHSQVFSPDNQENTNRKVPIGHKEYVYLSSCGKLEDDSGCFVTSMSLCEGDGSESFPLQQYYLNYHLRTPKYQCYYEFFLSDDLQALDSVSYFGACCDLFEQDEADDIKKSAIDSVSGVFRNSGCLCVSDMLEKIRLYNMMGSNFAALVIGEDKKNEPQTATESPTISTQEPCAEKGGQDMKADTNQDDQEKPVLVVTPHQLLAILAQCGGDQAKAVEMIQEMVASGNGSGPGLGMSQDSTQKADSGTISHNEQSEGVAGDGTKGEDAVPGRPGPHASGYEVKGEQGKVLEESLEQNQQDEEACQVQ